MPRGTTLDVRSGPISPIHSAISRYGWGSHTVRGGFDAGNYNIRLRDDGVAHVFIVQGWDIVVHGCGGTSNLDVVLRSNSRHVLAPLDPPDQQSADGGGISTACGAVSTRRITVLPQNAGVAYIYGRISGPGMGTYPPRVRGGTSTLSRGTILAARWLHELPPISNQPMGVGFPYRAGRYRIVGSLFSSPG